MNTLKIMVKYEPILSETTWTEIHQYFNNCRLCWAKSRLGQLYPENTILYSSEKFITIPALGSLIPGYLLMVSRQHIPCIAKVKESELAMLERELEKLLEYLKPLSDKWIVFEHGNSENFTRSSPSCIEHFHLHILPLNEKQSKLLLKYISRELGAKETINSFKKLPEYFDRNPGNYILLRNLDGAINVFTKSDIPSQYIRRVISTINESKEVWNWRIDTHADNIKLTLSKFKSTKLMKKSAYFAHAIENTNKKEIRKEIEIVSAYFSRKCPSIKLFSMFEVIDRKILKIIDSHKNEKDLLVDIELNFLKYSDMLIADISRIEWQYVGCLMEIVYAYNLGIPIIALVGDSKIQNRRWLKKHVSYYASSLENATDYINQNLLL